VLKFHNNVEIVVLLVKIKKKISMQNKKNTYQKEMAAVLKETVLSNFTTLEINIGEN